MLLLDADPQGSALTWQTAREGEGLFPVIGMPTKDIHRQLAPHRKHYDHIIIDSPPRTDALVRGIILATDVALMPVMPSPMDVWAVGETIKLLDEGAGFKPDIKRRFVVSRKIVGTAIGRDIVDILAGYNVPILEAKVSQRVAFAESIASGHVAMETEPNGRAAMEISALTEEIMSL